VTSVADPDPGSGAFLTPGSGMGKKYGSGMNNPDHISESLEVFHPGSRVKKIPDPRPASKNFSIYNPKIGL
jgi:hypothetical protein